MSPAGGFEQRLVQMLASEHKVLLIDEPSVQDEVGDFQSSYYDLCRKAGRPLFEFEGSTVNIESLIGSLRGLMENSPAHANVPENHFHVLCALLESHASGLICIRNAEQLTEPANQLLSKLASYIRIEELQWQILLIADTLVYDPIASAHMRVDAHYPDAQSGSRRVVPRRAMPNPPPPNPPPIAQHTEAETRGLGRIKMILLISAVLLLALLLLEQLPLK